MIVHGDYLFHGGSCGARDGYHLSLPASPHPASLLLLTVTAFYCAANALAPVCGFGPDVPPYLNKVTEML